MSAEPLNINQVLANADALLPEFRAIVDAMPAHERGPGIFLSEMFLMYCVLRAIAPARILESGRERGGSTCLFANCFPGTRIVSVEFERDGPHAAFALDRLAPHSHVECLFGDSREILPRMLQSGDAVFIDGPKDFRALKLALRLLRTGKASVVFVHDLPAGSPPREFLNRHWLGAFFSDQAEFFARFNSLDDAGAAPRMTTLGCLPAELPAPYPLLLAKLVASRASSLAPEKIERAIAKIRRSGKRAGQ